jgi:hypothetical protein
MVKHSLGVRCWGGRSHLTGSQNATYTVGEACALSMVPLLEWLRGDTFKGWPWRECCIWVAHGDFLAAAAATLRGAVKLKLPGLRLR